jgi:hypothetical protein
VALKRAGVELWKQLIPQSDEGVASSDGGARSVAPPADSRRLMSKTAKIR